MKPLLLPALAALSLVAPAAAAQEVPTLALGAAAPDFSLPGVDGRDLGARGLRRRQGPRRRLHLQPLPDRAVLRGAPEADRRRLPRQGRRLRRHHAQRPEVRSPRRAGLDRPGRLVRRDEDPRARPSVQLPLPLRRRHRGGLARLRPGGHAARVRVRCRAQAALRGGGGRLRAGGAGDEALPPRRAGRAARRRPSRR